MPVFRPGSKRASFSLNQQAITVGKKRKKIAFVPFIQWPITDSSLRITNRGLERDLTFEIKKMKKAFPGQRLRVLEWGVGKGITLLQLSRKFSSVDFIGFSDMSYRNWDFLNRKNIELIHSTTPVLERHLPRKPVHLIYSHFGITHLDPKEFISHVLSLKKGLVVGGRLIFGPLDAARSLFSKTSFKSVCSELERNGFSISYNPRHTSTRYPKGVPMVLTRVK